MQSLGASDKLLTITPVEVRSFSSEGLRLFNASERSHKPPSAGDLILERG